MRSALQLENPESSTPRKAARAAARQAVRQAAEQAAPPAADQVVDTDLYRLIFASLPFGMVVLDREERMVSVNPRAREMMGIGARIIDGARFDELFELVERVTDQENPGDIESEEVDLLLVRSPAHDKPLWGLKEVLRDGSGRIIGTIFILQDPFRGRMGGTAAAEGRMFHRIGRSTSSIAHELRNPLGGITGFASVLDRYLDESDPKKKIVRRIMKNAMNVDRIIDNLVEFTKVGDLSLEMIELRSLLDGLLRYVLEENEMLRSTVRVEKSYPPDPVYIRVDRIQIREAFYHIIRNAMDAMPEKGRLTVTMERAMTAEALYRPGGKGDGEAFIGGGTSGFVRTSISDNGEGMDPRQLQRAFDLFYSTRGDRNGLGLSIVEKIISNHHGTIDIESSKERGTTVTVSLMEYKN